MKKKGTYARSLPVSRTLAAVTGAVLRYPSIGALLAGVAGCHDGASTASPPPATHTHAPPPPVVAAPAPPPSTPVPPVAQLVAPPSGEPALPHEGDPCPTHRDGTVISEAAAAQLPRARRAALHPIHGIGVSGVSHMLGGGCPSGRMDEPRDSIQGVRNTPPQIVPGEPSIHGSLASAVVLQAVRGRLLPQVRACYLRELSMQPDFAGTLTVELTVAADGSVASSSATLEPVPAGDLSACAATAARHSVFPAASGRENVVIDVPIRLSPGE